MPTAVPLNWIDTKPARDGPFAYLNPAPDPLLPRRRQMDDVSIV
jgi:hypothetical protein